MGEYQQSAVVAASGAATITLPITAARLTYRVRQVSIMAPNVGGSATCGLYRDGMLITPMVAQGDAAAGEPPVDVRSGQDLSVIWAGADAGALVQALFLYDEVRPGG